MTANNLLASSIKFALIGGAVSAAASGFSVQAAEEKKEEGKVERIEITGSRIKRTDMENAQPVQLLSSDDIARTGLSNISDVLKEVSTNGASLGLQTNNGNTGGASRVNLRNCGSNRTLVLVNGRRWVADLNGSVDISTIPLAAVKSIEILKDGASSVYGTDAICGVVNVITKNDFEGAEVSAQVGQTSHDDGKREAFSATFGTTSEKTSVLLNLGYTKQGSIMGGDREISSVPIFGLPANVSASGGRASPTTPYGQFLVDKVSYTLKQDAKGCAANKECTTASIADFKPYDPNTDGYNYAPVNYIQQPQETLSLYGQGSHQLFEDVVWKSEVVFNERKSEAQLAAQPLGGLAIAADNLYNPFDKAIAGASFRPIVSPRGYSAEVDTWRFSTGLDGSFELAERTFNWDAYATYSDNSAVFLKNGFFHSERFKQATGSSRINSSTGKAECLTAPAGTPGSSVVAGCVPFNVFGGPNGVTQEMLDYVTVSPRDLSYAKMWDYQANIGTDVIELPAGWLAVNLGTEMRRESGYSSPEPLSVLGQVLGDNPERPTVGGFSLDEYYAEARIPLLADLPLVKLLEVEASTRYSDYSSFGDTTNNSYRLSYRPIDELLVRSSFNEGFRAPALTDLYRGLSGSRPAATDPCAIDSAAYKIPGVKERCLAAGVPNTFKQKDPQVRATVGGSADAQPETSESLTFGFVYSPSWLEGASLTADWYRIEIANVISSRSAASILSRCYVDGLPDACALITRDFTGTLNGNKGEISDVVSTTTNFVGGNHLEGIDWNVEYQFETPIGDWRVNWDSAYTIYDGSLGKLKAGEITADGVASYGNGTGRLTANSSGGGTAFRLKSNLTLAWSNEDWSASLTAQYLSKQIEDCSGITQAAAGLKQPELRNLCSNPDNLGNTYQANLDGTVTTTSGQSKPRNELSPTVYLDGQVGWESPWNNRVTVGVRNLLDQDPPLAFSAFANTYDPNYRTPGRFYYVNFNQKF